MMKRKLSPVLAALLAATMLLSACGDSAGGETADPMPAGDQAVSETETAAPSDTGEESAEPTVAPGKKGTLEYWSVFTGADGKSMQAMVDAYNATDPDYTVNHRAMEANDLYLKLPLAVQSQQDVPDLCINHVERLNLHSGNGYITDLTPYLEKAGITRDNYTGKLWDASDIGGGHYAVPLDSTGYVMFVNKDLYEKYGNGALDDGVVTWDEIEAAGPAASADGIMTVGIGWRRAAWLSGYGQLGGTMTQDGQTPLVNDEYSKQVLTTWRDLFNAGYTQKEGDTPWEMFLGGQVLYMVEGSWMLNQAVESGVNYQLTDYPVYDPAKKGHWASSHQFVLPRNDARPEEVTMAALGVVDYIGNNSMPWAEAGQIPAHRSVAENPEFEKMPQAFIAASDDATLKVYTYPYYGYLVEALDVVLDEIMYGRMEIEDGLTQAEQQTKDLIEMEG